MRRLVMIPGPGERLLRFVGDRVVFKLQMADGSPLPEGWRARLRTNLGRGDVLRREIIHAHTGRLRLTQASWRDVPMHPGSHEWTLSLPLAEVGYFAAKPYAMDPSGRQFWPDGPDVGVSIHADSARTANTIYCAFARMFGASKTRTDTQEAAREKALKPLDAEGYTAIPPSGKLRDLIKCLPHIMDDLGCRILHLLPVNPTPTTFARFGRFGSPYACQDLLAIDPALVEFDRRTTGVDQFRELTYAAHLKGGRVFLDVAINHTGWGSSLYEDHPEWYLRDANGNFVSPGAWGTTWEDLVELNHQNPALWEHLGDVFLEWCRRGVDGFRCDAGYKVPTEAWRYITARVLSEFPETTFLIEGLGGAWEATEHRLTDGGMHWAYSELFQNYSGRDVAAYLDYSLRQSARVGLYVHYSETHDNERLAAKGHAWSLLRNRLCALTSVSGTYGFTCGVEWLAPERLNVHQSRGLAWGNADNIVPELARLNHLLANHPCFFDNAVLTRLSPPDSHVLALSRVSAEGKDRVLVLVNTDPDHSHTFALETTAHARLQEPAIDLLGQATPARHTTPGGGVVFELPPGACYCLSPTTQPVGLSGELYRRTRAQAAWALRCVTSRFRAHTIGDYDWRRLAALVDADPAKTLAAIAHLDAGRVQADLVAAIEHAMRDHHYPQVVTWRPASRRRVTLLPSDHWLLVEDTVRFRATLTTNGGTPQHAHSIPTRHGHVAVFAPGQPAGDAVLAIERYTQEGAHLRARTRVVTQPPPGLPSPRPVEPSASVLLTNGIGGMARMQVDLGSVRSKYDCALAANLHPAVPVDRHVFVKRARVWINADGFITPLNRDNLLEFAPGPPARWRFVASAGDGRAVEVELTADMLDQRNTTVLRFRRPPRPLPFGEPLPTECHVSLTVRLDIEDRNFHNETHRNGGAEYHFSTHSRPLAQQTGFEFTPEANRRFRVTSDSGVYHHQPEWSEHVAHPVEASRGQVAEGDAYSPGWFQLPLEEGATATLVVDAGQPEPDAPAVARLAERRAAVNERALARASLAPDDAFGRQLALAVQAFVVRRDDGKTVIAGYPWFLDWGRDSLICARGLLAAGMVDEVKQLLKVFGRFEQHGTLPNTIHGHDASNRDTSDAPLWYGIVCEEVAALDPDHAAEWYASAVDEHKRPVADVLRSIAAGYLRGTPNGIRVDPQSALVHSPSHFTWMDTNFPAATPREGYPVEIQALWIRLLRQLARLRAKAETESWTLLAQRAEQSLRKLFWLEDRGYLADVLVAKPGQTAAQAAPDKSLRSNCLLPVALGLVQHDPARRCVQAALDELLVPGALRSLAPPRPDEAAGGRTRIAPVARYCGRYEGDEDTSRKLAYHNGTAWTWTLPAFCEALAKAWDLQPAAVHAARNYLGSMAQLLAEGCLGQLPEILDGDAPHTQRGCDAQAWAATEALRVWKWLRAVQGGQPPR